MAADHPGAVPALQDLDFECPDCAGELAVDDGARPTTDGGNDLPRSDDRAGLRGVDIQCDRCGTDLGVYVFP
jgi:hypothetical protein